MLDRRPLPRVSSALSRKREARPSGALDLHCTESSTDQLSAPSPPLERPVHKARLAGVAAVPAPFLRAPLPHSSGFISSSNPSVGSAAPQARSMAERLLMTGPARGSALSHPPPLGPVPPSTFSGGEGLRRGVLNPPRQGLISRVRCQIFLEKGFRRFCINVYMAWHSCNLSMLSTFSAKYFR